jgi:hypothetical protein|tara:strand:+ start:3334 stop:3801 length:468 start_codon:yes stop_codon:yes gene_type:complete
MIRNKNVFECIFKDGKIWFPNYVFWGPPSHGHMRRSTIFKKLFPDVVSNISTKETWENLRKSNWKDRRVFEYNEASDVLKEVDYQEFFTNAYGFVIKEGQKFKINNIVYTIEKLEVIKFAGLIATYQIEGKLKKTNVGAMSWNNKNNYWENINEN